MIVVFLDVDGVLNSIRSCIAFGGYPHPPTEHLERIDDVALRLIRSIVKTAGASVVLSSTWRKSDEWEKIGPALDLPIIDLTTTDWKPGQRRGHEIKMWLDEHPEVFRYAIIDDDSDMLPEQKPFFVKTNHVDGFLYADAVKLASYLGIDIYDVNHPKNNYDNSQA